MAKRQCVAEAAAASNEPPTVGRSTVSIEPGRDPDTMVTTIADAAPSLVGCERAADAIAPGLTLSDMMATVQSKWSRAAPAKVPWLDPAKTRVSKPMDPWTAL